MTHHYDYGGSVLVLATAFEKALVGVPLPPLQPLKGMSHSDESEYPPAPPL